MTIPTFPVRRVLILGGAGFLGSNLARFYLDQGGSVMVVDNFATGRRENLRGLPVKLVEQSVTDYWGWVPTGREFAPDAVFHLASPASPPAYQRMPVETMWANARGAENAVKLCRTTGSRLIFASTSEVYGDPLVHPQPEDYRGNVDPVGPRSMYDEAKRFTEALITAYRSEHPDLSLGIVRIFNTYGPRMDPEDGRVIPNFVRAALNGEPLTVYGDGSQTRSLCYVDDLLVALDRMARRPDVTGPVNLGNPEEISMSDLAAAVLRAVSDVIGEPSPSRIEYGPATPDDPRLRRPVIDRAERQLGWTPRTPLAEGLRRTVEHVASPASAADPAPALSNGG